MLLCRPPCWLNADDADAAEPDAFDADPTDAATVAVVGATDH